MNIMSVVKDQINEWYLELENILGENQGELDEVAVLIENNKHIAAFNYVDKFIDKNKIETSESYKDMTIDLYLSLK